MSTKNFLDKRGLSDLWVKIKQKIPTRVSQLENDQKYLTSYTESDPTVPDWAKSPTKPAYTASEVGADASGSASAVQTNLDTHVNNKSNPHGVTLAQLGLTADATELNYVDGVTSNIQTQLNTANTNISKKVSDMTIEIYNGNGGINAVKFLAVDYSSCGSENGVAIKISMVSGHGNGTSYAFLQDVIIKVGYTGSVSVDNFKYYGANVGTYDSATRQYGDIFWVIDETNKIVDFYCLMGQYSRVYQSPFKRVTYSIGGTITQYTRCTVYSSGIKVYGNNSNYALQSQFDALSSEIANKQNKISTENWTFTLEDGSTVTKAVYVG